MWNMREIHVKHVRKSMLNVRNVHVKHVMRVNRVGFHVKHAEMFLIRLKSTLSISYIKPSLQTSQK